MTTKKKAPKRGVEKITSVITQRQYNAAVDVVTDRMVGASRFHNAIVVIDDNELAYVWEFGEKRENEFFKCAIDLEIQQAAWFPVYGMARRIDKPTTKEKPAATKAKKEKKQ